MKRNESIVDIINWGVTDSLKVEEAQIVRLTNMMGIFPYFFYLFFIGFGLLLKIPFIWQTGIVIVVVNSMGLWCNFKGFYSASKTILLMSNSFVLLLAVNVIKDNFSAITFYFPLLAVYITFYDIREEWGTILMNLTITVGCIFLCFILPDQAFGRVTLPYNISQTASKLNYFVAFSAFAYYIFTISKVKVQSESLLIQSRITAEQMAHQLAIEKDKAERAGNAKSRFLSHMSHELRTPLNGIIGTTNFLLQENAGPSVTQHLDVLKYSSEHMLAIINDILDFNKIEAGKLNLDRNTFNLNELIEKITAVFKHQFTLKGVNFIIELDRRLDKEVLSDDTRLNQVLSNLISNALKFTPQGAVTLNIQIVSSNSDTMMVNFAVSDTGIGIPQEKLSEVFSSFTQADTKTTRQYGGTGLGLTISRKLVENFGGELNVRSEVGRGSCFYFTIPIDINNGKRSFVTENKILDLQDLEGTTVLVAEDNRINMMITKKFLENWKIKVIETRNGREALEAFKSKQIDLLLIDLEMPEMDGYEALTEIRKIDKRIPAIAFTAAVFDDMQQKLLSHGFTDFIHKPFRPEELHKKLLRNSQSLMNHSQAS